MTPGAPPSDVPPEELFRRLMVTPRPIEPLSVPFAGWENFALSVRALTPGEQTSAMGRRGRSTVQIARGLLYASLVTDDGPAFRSPAEVGELDEGEALAIAASAVAVLARISPAYGYVDSDAWLRTLEKGAQHRSNLGAALALATCVDVSLGPGVSVTTPRPDRYFGVPIKDLLDGHWMCFVAARRVADAYSKR